MPGAFGIGGGSGGGSPFAGDIIVDNDTDVITIGNGETAFAAAGSGNIWFAQAPLAAITSEECVVIGNEAGKALTSGSDNTIVGFNAGIAVTTGVSNTLIGSTSVATLATGSNNVVIGSGADVAAVDTLRAVVIGYQAKGANRCTIIGDGAGGSLTTGGYNVAVGESAGASLTTGAHNTLLGDAAGQTTATGSNNTIIGVASDTGAATSGAVVIGNSLTVVNDNAVNIGGVLVCDAAANADLQLIPQGTGKVSFGVYAAGAAVQGGTISIKDAAGNVRQILCV